MAKQMARSEEFKTPPCVVSYSKQLFEARKQNEKAAPKFGCTLIFKNEHKAALGKLVMDVMTAEFGANAVDRVKNGLLKSPLLAGDGKEARNKETGELHPGMGPDVFFIRPNANEDRPPVVRWKSQHVAPTPDEVYSGCEGFAVINAYAYPARDGGIAGVALGISYFQKTGEGERLGGSGGPIDVSKYFEKIEDAGAAPAATQGGAGAEGLFS
jgi:hypothetical protein